MSSIKEIIREDSKLDWQVAAYGTGLFMTGLVLAGTLMKDDSYDGHICSSVDNQITLLSPVIGKDDTFKATGIRMGTIKENISRDDMTVGNMFNSNLPSAQQEFGGASFFQLDHDANECMFGSIEFETWTVPYVDTSAPNENSEVKVRVSLNL